MRTIQRIHPIHCLCKRCKKMKKKNKDEEKKVIKGTCLFYCFIIGMACVIV